MFHIFGPRYPSALKPQPTVFTNPTESQFVCGGYIGYFSVQKFHVLSEQLDFHLFYTSLLPIFLDFLHELLQNYLFLVLFYHITSILRDCMRTEIQ